VICHSKYPIIQTFGNPISFRKKELRRSKLLEKPINFSRFTLGAVWESLSKLRLHLFCANRGSVV